jgi:lipoprotein-anchoring transpeptidase ErfK/SrfK
LATRFRRYWLGLAPVAAAAAAAALLIPTGGPAGPATPGAASGGGAAVASDMDLIPAPPPSRIIAAQAPAQAPHTLLPVPRWLKSGEYAWAAEQIAPGPIAIVVDLRARTLSVYRQGSEIGRSSIIYGADNKPTPTGTFPVIEKRARHFSNLYNNAPMPWMMRLTMDGVAIHGSDMADDAGTHGCIGLPHEFAEQLFALAQKGTRVIVNNGPPQRANYATYAALPYGAAL